MICRVPDPDRPVSRNDAPSDGHLRGAASSRLDQPQSCLIRTRGRHPRGGLAMEAVLVCGAYVRQVVPEGANAG